MPLIGKGTRHMLSGMCDNRSDTRGDTKVVSNLDILGGMPVLSGTRIPAETVLAEIHAGKSRFDIFRHYPSLPLDGVEACLAWESAGRPV
jgi:uncharacterized protein (DUF433 family)